MQRKPMAFCPRVETGKGPNRQLRAAGRIPAVLYGVGAETTKMSLDAHDFGKLIHGVSPESTLFDIVAEGSAAAAAGEETVAVIREIQRDPVTRAILHVDLYRIRMDVENEFEVPVHPHGIAIGVREGGILETHMYSVLVRCLPANLPTGIDVDVVNLAINSALHVRDLKAPEGVTFASDADMVIYTILPPKAEATPTPGAAVEGEETAQPEVIGRKKEDEEEDKEKKEKK